MKTKIAFTIVLLFGVSPRVLAQASAKESFKQASASIQKRLERSLSELSQLREKIAGEKISMGRRLSESEAKLSTARLDYQEKVRLVDSTTLDMVALRNEIKKRKEETVYLSDLLSEYLRNFESRLHIVELQRFRTRLEKAKLAGQNTGLSRVGAFRAQSDMLELSLERIEDVLGGTRFPGLAVDSSGLVNQGTFALLGPIALFRSADGKEIGLAEQRLGSLEPTLIQYANPEDTLAAGKLVEAGQGVLPADLTLGDAHKMEATRETLLEHVQKGGPVMIPIVALAAAALFVALWRWLVLTFISKPSRRQLQGLLDAVSRMDSDEIQKTLGSFRGPTRDMLSAGVDHLGEPRELIEEVMYEDLLKTRLRVNRFLPFISISAASAPLLGLLGTVTGIINTFRLITVHGSGDPKMLSGGISEALITTKFGLVVAIPCLLLHAWLSRKAKGITGDMEQAAIRFVNEVSKAKGIQGTQGASQVMSMDSGRVAMVPLDPDIVRIQVSEIIGEMLGPLTKGQADDHAVSSRAG